MKCDAQDPTIFLFPHFVNVMYLKIKRTRPILWPPDAQRLFIIATQRRKTTDRSRLGLAARVAPHHVFTRSGQWAWQWPCSTWHPLQQMRCSGTFQISAVADTSSTAADSLLGYVSDFVSGFVSAFGLTKP